MTEKRKRSNSRPLLLLLILAPLPLCSQDRAVSSGEAFRHWVPAERAVVGGEIQEGLLSPAGKVEIRSWLRKDGAVPSDPKAPKATDPSKAGCDVLLVTSAGNESAEPAKALEEAAYGVLGAVTAIEPGLFRGRIASIVTVEVDEWLQAPEAFSRPATLHFVYEDARLTVGDTTYCRQGARKDRLAVGRQVFLATSTLLQENPVLLLPYDRQLFFETANQGVSAPGKAAQARKSWSDFEALFKQGKGGD
jgi:hypothetical protein